MSWPADADGDVFRNLEQNGFDFGSTVLVDFNVDVPNADAMADAIDAALDIYPDAAISEEDTYFVVQLETRVTYELVIETQKKLTAAAAPFGGKCDSWGVLAD
jgi:hypothetical protein